VLSPVIASSFALPLTTITRAVQDVRDPDSSWVLSATAGEGSNGDRTALAALFLACIMSNFQADTEGA
jgi:hypothetical protein